MKYVYVIKNLKNKKVYVGSSQCPTYRMQAHMYNLRKHRHKVEDFQSDYDKYGEEAFEMRILGEYKQNKEGLRMEVFFMNLFRSKERGKGYNYKDRFGTSQRAKYSKWRRTTSLWNYPVSQWEHLEAIWALSNPEGR